MPNDLLAPETPATDHPELLNFLKGKDNPFDLFVAARKPEADWVRYHVPAVHRELFSRLNAVLERFRVARLERESDLPRSGVVVVLGVRGMGKTHMVHALQRTAGDAKPRVVVTPSIYEPHRPFIEYLLHQLVRHFQNETDGREPGTLELLADALARQVLVQAFHGMTEVEWLARNVTGKGSFWRLFFGFGTGVLSYRKRLLIQDLGQREVRTILEVCQQHEQDLAALRVLALEQIDQVEPGHTIAGQIRRRLYTHLVRLAFGEPRESIYEFLLDGYTQVESKTLPSRDTLVDELFQALLELCLLAEVPVVFAFDALESLLGDPPEEKLCHPFFKGLADVLDSHRGIPFLLFAELGHWQQAQRFMSSYAEQRFLQGVIRVPQYGSVSTLTFPEVSPKQLGEIVAARMKPLLVEFHESEHLDAPAIFPFQEEDLSRIARTDKGQTPPLRQALQRLLDRYDELVNGTARRPDDRPKRKAGDAANGKNFIEPLETCWQREQRKAKGKLEAGGLGMQADELHAGILKWFESLIAEGTSSPGGKPVGAANQVVGAHPTYGQLTRYQWSNGKDRQDIGLGLLLGTGPGMRHDLETKLKMIAANPEPVDTLIVLWPKGGDVQPPIHENFPQATRAVWDKYEKMGVTRRVQLRSIALEDVVPWLAMPPWLNAIRTEVEGVSADVVHHFVTERTAALLSLVTPRS
jgi:hypothetical protein